MTKKESNSKKILILMLVLPLLILGTVLIFTHDKTVIKEKSSTQQTVNVSNTPAQGSKTEPGNATLLLEPRVGTLKLNETLSVKLYEDSGNEEIISVDVGLEYDSSKLEFISIDSKDSKFQQLPNENTKKNLVSVTGFIFPPETLTGKQLIATVNFKVIANSGNTSIKFLKDDISNKKTHPLLKSAIFSKNDVTNIWDQNTDGGIYYTQGLE